MPPLRRHRRPRNRKGHLRAYAPKPRRRRNLTDLIPKGDSDFAFMAERVFLSHLRSDPEAYGVTEEEVAQIAAAVSAFRSALYKAQVRVTRNPQAVMAKDAAREKAEAIVRRYRNIISANPDVSDSNKKLLRIKVRPKKLGKRKCPQQPPRLAFLGSGDGQAGGSFTGSGSGVHVLRYADGNDVGVVTASSEIGRIRRAKPDGAVRIELYFDMVPPGEPVPKHPAERGWPKYLRSFTRSPMEVAFPVPTEPMLVVYWARWADSTGEVSRWSKPCIARVEGWSHAPTTALPQDEANRGLPARARQVETKYVYVQTPIAGDLPGDLESDAAHRQIAALHHHLLDTMQGTTSRMLEAG
jgi:hypothetical protein